MVASGRFWRKLVGLAVEVQKLPEHHKVRGPKGLGDSSLGSAGRCLGAS